MKNNKAMSTFFNENLKAPLKNVQWSWGAENDKGIFLRVWKDENINENSLIYMNDKNDTRLGQSERLKHVQLIEKGKPGYVVLITDGVQTPDGNWKIEAYEECIFSILKVHTNENGDVYARIDFDNPIIPDFLGVEIDVNGIIDAAKANKLAQETLEKAMNKFGWQPTKICDNKEKITLVSKDGKQFATILVSKGEWARS